jgi:hypothetical protein
MKSAIYQKNVAAHDASSFINEVHQRPRAAFSMANLRIPRGTWHQFLEVSFAARPIRPHTAWPIFPTRTWHGHSPRALNCNQSLSLPLESPTEKSPARHEMRQLTHTISGNISENTKSPFFFAHVPMRHRWVRRRAPGWKLFSGAVRLLRGARNYR